MAASADAPLAGRYRVLRRLGAGGVATVFLAEDERLGRQVAVKRLHASRAEEMAERFEREARLGASLNDPNLVAVYDITADAEAVIIVMEYVDGETLADAVRRGPLSTDRAMAVLRGVAAGLDHAHAQRVVHRDVKPANVLLGVDGRVKLADLGIAIAAEATHITRSGTVLGTPSYMAPEQLEGGPVGPAVDVYALATMAFEALSGRKARPGGTPIEVAHRVATEPPPDVREAWPDAPPALAETLRAGMAADPADRPRSAGELVERLSAALADAERSRAASAAAATPAQPPSTPPARPSRGRWLALAAVALVALGVLAAVLATGGEDAPEPEQAAGEAEEAPAEEGPAEEAPVEEAPAGDDAGSVESPEDAVTSFYESAAAGDYDAAWALATPSFRNQLGGFEAFQRQQSTLESIEFQQAETRQEAGDTAEVEISTTATHTDYVENCTGTLSLVTEGDGWLVDQAEDISCTPA